MSAMSWFHSFLLVLGFVLLLSVQPVDGTTSERRLDSPGPQTTPGGCGCCKNEKVWEGVAYIKTLIMWLRSKMADAGSEAAQYQRLNQITWKGLQGTTTLYERLVAYLKSFEYKYLVYKSKHEPEPEIDWPW